MTGQELFEQVFGDEIEELYEIEDLDGVTNYDEVSTSRDGWYFENTYEFRYNGKKYAFEVRDHSSDNVCDTTYLMGSFRVVKTHNVLEEEIEKIISGIENQSYDTFEEIIGDLEDLKRKFNYLIEY